MYRERKIFHIRRCRMLLRSSINNSSNEGYPPLSRDVVHSQPKGSPEGDHDGKYTKPNGDDGDDDEGGCGDGSHNVGPHARHEHHLHEEGQPGLIEWAVGLAEHDLEVTLQDIRHVSDLLSPGIVGETLFMQ